MTNVRAIAVGVAGPGHVGRGLIPYRDNDKGMVDFVSGEIEKALRHYNTIERIMLRNPLGQYRDQWSLPAFTPMDVIQRCEWLAMVIGWWQARGFKVDLYGHTMSMFCPSGDMSDETIGDREIATEADAMRSASDVIAVMELLGADRVWFDAPGSAADDHANIILEELAGASIPFGLENIIKPEKEVPRAYGLSEAFISLCGNVTPSEGTQNANDRERPTPEELAARDRESRRLGKIQSQQESWIWIHNGSWEGPIETGVNLPVCVPTHMLT